MDYSVMQLLGGENYKVNQKFIQRLFKKQDYFLDTSKNPDLYKIAKTLKQNGLLKLGFKSPMELEVVFSVTENPHTFVGTLYDILNEMGYYYFLVKQSVFDAKQFKFTLSMNTEYAIDPVLLQEKLREYGYKVQGIERTNLYQWNYAIALLGFKSPKAIPLKLGEMEKKVDLKGEYLFALSNGKALEIASSNGILWYPKLVFFDANLNILEIINTPKAVVKINEKIPKKASYVKITDAYLPITIKNGLDVTMQ